MNRYYLSLLKNPKIKKYLGFAALIIAIIFILVFFNPFSQTKSLSSGNSKASLKEALNTVILNKEFNFPLKDEKSEVVGEIKYVIENVELRDEIIIKGKKAYAVEGRAFLILNLKIVNNSNKTISMNTKDYARLSVNGNESELLAPSIHNDPVVIDAISTKPTRIGYAISKTDKDIKLKVGEIQGEKTTIDIKF